MSDQVTAVTDVTSAPEVAAPACLVIVYQRGREPGRCYKLLDSPVRIGRSADNDIQLEDQGVSRRHARIERLDGRLVLMDVGSTNGTLLNGAEVQETVELTNGDQIKVGSTIFKYLSAADLEAALHEQIYENTIQDHLTQLYNKRFLEDALLREFSRARRHSRPLALLFIDVDHFKYVNDKRGHHVGDMALKATADAIRRCVRAEDVVARFGGEEFVALLPETALEEAATVAEKIRTAVAANPISYRHQRFTVTVSIGCAAHQPSDTHAAAFLERCDKKLYEAKHSGRNCVRF